LAIQDYSNALELQPDSQLAYNNRGMAYVLQKQYQSAAPDFDRALALRPDKIAPRISRRALRVVLGDLDGALEDCNLALQMQKIIC
jgi:tetratricopeptide (TPR) repeat protein